MIKKIEDNNVLEAIQLMDKSTDGKQYGYDRNEAVWIKFFLNLVEKQKEGNPHYLVIGDYNADGKLKGFLSASTFINYYTNEYVMDVKDCIVDHNCSNTYVVYRLFDAMIAHLKENGGKRWRADSIRSEQEAMNYGRFLQHRYDAEIHVSVKGIV